MNDEPTIVAAPLELHIKAHPEGIYLTEHLGPVSATILMPWGNLDAFIGGLMDANAARVAAQANGSEE